MKKLTTIIAFLFTCFMQVNAQNIWKGTAYQPDVKETWDIVLSIKDTDTIFSIAYPSLNCKGKWKIKNHDDYTIVLEEQITEGKDICIENSLVYLTKIGSPELLSVVYKNIDDSTKIYAYGILQIVETNTTDTINTSVEETINGTMDAVVFADTVTHTKEEISISIKKIEGQKTVEELFSTMYYDLFFDKNKIYFDCNKCEAPTMEIEIAIDSYGSCRENGIKIISGPTWSCEKITETMITDFWKMIYYYFENCAYPKILINSKQKFIVRPTKLLKC